MTDLKGFLIDLSSWSLELAIADSTKGFTSYANLEMRIVVHKFNVASDVSMELDKKYPVNLYRDDTCRTFINEYIFKSQQATLQAKFEKDTPAKLSLTDDVTVKTAVPNFYVTLEGDSSETGEFKGYQALKRTKTEILNYSDLISIERNSIPQAALKKSIEDGNVQTEKDLIYRDDSKSSPTGAMKKTTTMRVKKDSVEVVTKVVKRSESAA